MTRDQEKNLAIGVGLGIISWFEYLEFFRRDGETPNGKTQ